MGTELLSWSLFFAIVGAILNLIGIAFTIKATINVWHAYGPGPVWPWVNKALTICRIKLKRLSPWNRRGKNTHTQVASACFAVTASVRAKLRKRLGFKGEGDSVEKRIGRIEKAITGLYRELDENEADSQSNNSSLRKSISELKQKLEDESRRLEAFSKEAVSGDIRLQLIGLLFIGFGTLISSVAHFFK